MITQGVKNIESCRIIRFTVENKMMIYVLEVFYKNGDVERGLKIPFADVLGKNEIRRPPSINKVRDFLNSKEGLEYLERKFID